MAGKNTINPQSLSDNVIALLSEADKRNNHPPGTMFALMQQETSGNQKFIDDPTTYHYPLDETGKRKSSAAGPYGILNGTGKDPGYGVQPLKDNSFAEHTRFASDYLKARGAAAYGTGPAYAAQLQARIQGNQPVVAARVVPTVVPVADPRSAPVEVPVAQAAQVAQAQQQVPATAMASNPGAWQQWLDARQTAPNQVAAAPEVIPEEPSLQIPNFMAGLASQRQPQQAAFQMLKALKGWA